MRLLSWLCPDDVIKYNSRVVNIHRREDNNIFDIKCSDGIIYTADQVSLPHVVCVCVCVLPGVVAGVV